MKVKYFGSSHVRVIRPQDAERADVKLDKELTWEQSSSIDVSNEVGEWLTKTHKDEFSVERAKSSGESSSAPASSSKPS